MTTALVLSIIATALSVASFSSTVWRAWRDRPRLLFYVMAVNFTNVPKLGQLKMVRVKIANVGYRPLVLTRFMAFGAKSSFAMGIDDEPAAMFGQEDPRFPTLLEPGKTLTIHPISVAALERNFTKPDNDSTFFDPFKYFAAIDSFNRLHPIDADDMCFHLHLTKQRIIPNKWLRLRFWISKQWFLQKARRSLKRWPHA